MKNTTVLNNMEGFIFDLDGTLLDSMGMWHQIDVDFLARRGFEVPVDYQNVIAAMKNWDVAVYTIERFHLNEEPEDLIREWLEMAEEAYRYTIAPKPFAIEFLKECKNKGKKMALATSSDRALIWPALERTGILDYMDTVVTAQEVERGKGFPDIYLKAAKNLGTTPENSVVFEDIPEGIKGAKLGGFTAVGVFDAASVHQEKEIREISDAYIRSFGELISLVH